MKVRFYILYLFCGIVGVFIGLRTDSDPVSSESVPGAEDGRSIELTRARSREGALSIVVEETLEQLLTKSKEAAPGCCGEDDEDWNAEIDELVMAAQSGPGMARAILGQVTSHRVREAFLGAFWARIPGSTPAEAMEVGAGLLDSLSAEERVRWEKRLEGSVLRNWMHKDFDAAWRYVDDESANIDAGQAKALLLTNLAAWSPDKAFALAVEELEYDRIGPKAFHEVLREWLYVDREAAWSAVRAAGGELFNSAVAASSDEQVAFIAQENREWLAELDESSKRRVAAGWFAEDPVAAIDWLRGLEDPDFGRNLVLGATIPSTAMARAALDAYADDDRLVRRHF